MCCICAAGLGPELEELMVEGFLLQVTLPETEQLYRYLFYKLAPLPSRSSPSSKKTDQNQSSPKGSPHKKVLVLYYMVVSVFGLFYVQELSDL